MTDTERFDRIAEEFAEQLRRGESPSIEEYAAAHPELADDLRNLLPTLAMIEASAPTDEPTATPASFPGLELLDGGAEQSGGMGRVYRARDTRLDRVVAIKVTRQSLDTPEGRASFEAEARAAASLDHPNIVRIHSFHPDHQPPYSVMQYVEGQSLGEACHDRSPRDLATLVEKIARALAFAHARGVVHRDVKPANVVVDFRDEPHVLDFGLARPVGSDATVAGTPRYIAPEVLDGSSRASPASDIYALGVTLYTLLAGGPPPDQGEPPLLIAANPEVPEALQRICLVAMERDPEQRYATAELLADDLRRYLDGRDVFARPSRYREARRGQLANHLTDLSLWRQQSLIDTREMDQLARPYRRLIEADSAWDDLSRRFPWETAVLRLGGWLAVVSSVLWLAFYWNQLARPERVAAVGVPFALVTVAGWVYLQRRGRGNAVVFLSTGSLLWPMWLGVLLAEYGWLRFPMATTHELFGEAVASADPTAFYLTNAQLTVITGAFLGYALLLLQATRATLFVFWVGTGWFALYASAMLLAGMRHWIETDRTSLAVLSFAVPALCFVPLAGLVRRRGPRAWAAILYTFFPLPMAAVLTLLARTGAEDLFGCELWEDRGVQLWLMANGALYFALGRGHVRATAGFTRFWGELFTLLVPVSLLVPTNILFEREPFLGTAGGVPISVFEYAAALSSIGLVLLGTQSRRAAIAVPGVVGLAVTVLRVTERHFAETLAWPLTLAGLGAVAMAAGAVMIYRRGRANRQSVG